MNWKKELLQEPEFGKEITNRKEKEALAKKIASYVKDGEVIGFGSGSTAFLTAIEIGKRVSMEKLSIKAIPTSYEIKLLCSTLGIETTSILEKKPDWCFDGADEVDQKGWVIKGRGAAMFKEKLNIIHSPRTYLIIDKTKLVSQLGENFPIPIEVFPDAMYLVKDALFSMGATKITLRSAEKKDGPVITESGNFILDTKFEHITESLEKEIKAITGVIESGLFINYPFILEEIILK